MKIRLDIASLVLHDPSMSRRERMALREDIGRELSRLTRHGAADTALGRCPPSPVATQIAAAVAAQLPAHAAATRTGPRT